MKQSIKISMVLTLSLFLSNAWAGSVSIPHAFSSGQPAVATEVNANFTAVRTAVDDNDGRISTNATNVSTNVTNIGNLQSSATAAVTAIQTNANNIGNLQNSATATANLLNQVAGFEDDGSTVIGVGDVIDFVESDSFIRHLVGGEVFMVDTTIFAGGSFYRVTTGFDTPISPAVIADLSPYYSSLTEITLSGSGGSSGVPASTADNPPINVDCTNGESLQAAIETAPLHGKVIIEISGTCIDDIYLRRSGITIQGAAGDKSDVIQGNATGFSSAASENYQYTAVNPVGSVQRPPNSTGGMRAAFESRSRRGVLLKDLTINAGSNSHAIRVGDNNRLILNNVTLNGHNYGMRVFNNSVVNLTNTAINTDGASGIDDSGNGTCNNPFCGSGIFASVNSSIILKSGNTINSAANALDGYGLAAINGVAISLRGANNNIESLSIIGSNFEQTRFEQDGTGNQIRGDLEVCLGSSFIAQQININAGNGESEISVCAQSSVFLKPRSSGAISVTTQKIDVEGNSLFIVSDGDRTTPFPVAFAHPTSGNKIDIDVEVQSSFVNENGGSIPANFDVGGSSNLSLDNGTTINGNVDMFQNSSFFSEANSDINGNLDIDGFSTYFAVEQGSSVVAGNANQSVSGTVICGSAEAIETEGDDSGATNNLCSATE